MKPTRMAGRTGTERYSSEIRYGGSNFEFASRISNYDKSIIGVRICYIMLIEPPYTACPELGFGETRLVYPERSRMDTVV